MPLEYVLVIRVLHVYRTVFYALVSLIRSLIMKDVDWRNVDPLTCVNLKVLNYNNNTTTPYHIVSQRL